MRILTLLTVVFVLFSCAEPTKKAEVSYKYDDFFIDFYKQRPWFQQNSIIKDKVGDTLKVEYAKAWDNDLLTDLPLRLVYINEYNEDKYCAHFRYDYTGLVYDFDLEGDVLVLLPDTSVIKDLVDDSIYNISANFERYLGIEYKDYTPLSAITPAVWVTEEKGSLPEFSLGVILLKAKSIKKAL